MKTPLIRATAITCRPCLGHNFVPIDIDRLTAFKAEVYADHIHYLMGGKAQESGLGTGVIDFMNGIDCSGWNRKLLDYITHGILSEDNFPDGSYTQGHWMIDNGFYCHSIGTGQQYLDAATANDNLFRDGYHWPGGRNGDSTGHVFPLFHDHTSESSGGRGPNERPAEHQWFVDHCDLVVVVGPLLTTAQWANEALNPYLGTNP